METSIQKRFLGVDTSNLPQFEDCCTILEQSMWVLWVAKEKLQEKNLTSNQISLVLRDVKEISVNSSSISQSLRRAGNEVHVYHQEDGTYYEIMKPGKEHLVSLRGENEVELFYFEPEKKYTSKRQLSTQVLNILDGEVRIVDPYCGERTLDMIKEIKGKPVKFLTKIDNITNKTAKETFLRTIKDFKTENPDIEFKNYPNIDLHDRYIVTPRNVVLLGHSMKDLGGKESFAIILSEASCKNIHQALKENFDRRWDISSPL
jgi:hypothetical protein